MLAVAITMMEMISQAYIASNVIDMKCMRCMLNAEAAFTMHIHDQKKAIPLYNA